MKYRAEIDGLRALAVVPVILFHAGFEVFSGGFVGVDVFFVISGYLITSILIENIENKSFSIINFYERRARRILPALFFLFFITIMFSIIFLPPHALKDVGQSVFAASLFFSNIFFYIETDYFANTSELAPLLHTWSLSTEEQFYIIFPFLLFLTKNFSKFLKFNFFLVLLIFSLLASQFWVQIDSQFSFYMPFTRFWEIIIGTLLAISRSSWDKINSKLSINILPLIGLMIILFCITFYNRQTVFPGFNAIPPVLGTALIIMFAREHSLIYRLLTTRVLMKVGLISYSLYLSHNAVFALSRNIAFPLDSYLIKITLIILSFIIATFSYLFIEKPLRFLNVSSMKFLISCLLISLLFSTLGYYLHKTHGLKELKLSNLKPNMAKKVINVETEIKARKLEMLKPLSLSSENFTLIPKVKKVLILGDSKSEDLYVSLIKKYSGKKYQFRRMELDDSEMQEPSTKLDPASRILNSKLFLDSDEIILSSTWQNNTNSNVLDFTKYLLSQGKKVSIVSTANFNDLASLSYVVAKRNISNSDLNSFMFENIRWDWRKQYLSLKTAINNLNLKVKFLDKLEAFCDLEEKSCNLKKNNDWYIYDSGHLTTKGLEYFGDFAAKKWFSK